MSTQPPVVSNQSLTAAQVIQAYVNLLIMQYQQPNAQAHTALLVGELLQNQIIAQVRDGFNFSFSPPGVTVGVSAIGAQLNVLAGYRGLTRVLYGAPNLNNFVFNDVANPSGYSTNGFMDMANPANPGATTWLFDDLTLINQPIYSLPDDLLYRLVQLKTIIDSSFWGLGELDAIFYQFFGNKVAILDNGNMTMYYADLNSDTDFLFTVAAVAKVLPRPAGVTYTAFRTDFLSNFFGFQDVGAAYDATFPGFSDAATALTVATFLSAG